MDKDLDRSMTDLMMGALQMTWRPIESAPKDQLILIASTNRAAPYAGIDVGFWDHNQWSTCDGRWLHHASHWMPLPEPPK